MDIIVSEFIMPREMAIYIAKQARAKRLSLDFSQQTLAARSGVSYGTLKKFERTGKISLESLLKLAHTLGCITPFGNIFVPKRLEENKRERGRN
jgi:transcriptional regulator with XRE-family HTH domain